MKHATIVGTRLPKGLVQDLEQIERIEQSDRSTTVRKLLSHAVDQWKLDYYAKQYGQGKLSMARAARDAGVKRFVYASSSSVYGDDPRLPKVESSIGRPLSPYAATKAIDEVYAAAFASADFLIFFLNIMIVKITVKRVTVKSSIVINIPK